MTSGYSSVFPPGIIVGRIKHVYNSENGLSYRLNIALSTDFSRLRDVSVINSNYCVLPKTPSRHANKHTEETNEPELP